MPFSASGEPTTTTEDLQDLLEFEKSNPGQVRVLKVHLKFTQKELTPLAIFLYKRFVEDSVERFIVCLCLTDFIKLKCRQELLVNEQPQTTVHSQCCALKATPTCIDFMIFSSITGTTLKARSIVKFSKCMSCSSVYDVPHLTVACNVRMCLLNMKNTLLCIGGVDGETRVLFFPVDLALDLLLLRRLQWTFLFCIRRRLLTMRHLVHLR